MPSRSALILLVVAALVLAGGCTGDDDLPGSSGDPAVSGEAAKVAALDPRAVDATIVATVAVPRIEVFAAPGAAAPSHGFDNPLASGAPLVFLVERTSGAWHQVLLPIQPTGSIGWVRAADVTLATHNYRIGIDLDGFRLEVHQNGRLLHEIPVGIDPDSVPSPGAFSYTTERISLPTPGGPLGPYAYGVSGWSATVQPFTGAPGQFGIHGTDDGGSIGAATSSGSVRMRNDDIALLATFLPVGVPVIVSA